MSKLCRNVDGCTYFHHQGGSKAQYEHRILETYFLFNTRRVSIYEFKSSQTKWTPNETAFEFILKCLHQKSQADNDENNKVSAILSLFEKRCFNLCYKCETSEFFKEKRHSLWYDIATRASKWSKSSWTKGLSKVKTTFATLIARMPNNLTKLILLFGIYLIFIGYI